ncbi:MAG: gamma-glutamyltransferase, partial [Steroidobacteraceae bacterium]
MKGRGAMLEPNTVRSPAMAAIRPVRQRGGGSSQVVLALALAAFGAMAGASGGAPAAVLATIGHAPAATRAALERARPVIGRHAMVVSAQHLATMVGVDILKRGGNAIDAAVAVGYAEAVVHPCCGNIGGGGFMLIHLENGRNLFLNFRERAPLRATPTMFQDAAGKVVPNRSTDSYLGVGVPGTVMGLDTALAKYGTMSLQEVMAPAIELAREGYVLQQGDVNILNDSVDDFARHRNVAAIFLNQGKPFVTGQRLIQKQLAQTLEQIADGGTNAFYRGPIARAVVRASQANGGILSSQDFDDYSVQWEKPIQCSYHGYTILSAPPPSSGGTTLCEILQIIKP